MKIEVYGDKFSVIPETRKDWAIFKRLLALNSSDREWFVANEVREICERTLNEGLYTIDFMGENGDKSR